MVRPGRPFFRRTARFPGSLSGQPRLIPRGRVPLAIIVRAPPATGLPRMYGRPSWRSLRKCCDRFPVLALVLLLAAPLAGPRARQRRRRALRSPAPDRRPVLELSLDDAVRADAREQRGHRGGAVQPRVERLINIRELQGFYEPYLTSTISQNSATRPATNAFSGAPTSTTTPGPTTSAPSRTSPPAAPAARLQQQPQQHQQRVLDLQPVLQLRLQPELQPAVPPQLPHRFHAAPDQGGQEEPRDLRRAVPPDRGQHRGQREAARTTTSSTPSTTWRPSARAWPWPASSWRRTRSRSAWAPWPPWTWWQRESE